jgi:hypothetical protein
MKVVPLLDEIAWAFASLLFDVLEEFVGVIVISHTPPNAGLPQKNVKRAIPTVGNARIISSFISLPFMRIVEPE